MELTSEGAVAWRLHGRLKPADKRELLGFSPSTRELNMLGMWLANWDTPVAQAKYANGGENSIPAGQSGRDTAADWLSSEEFRVLASAWEDLRAVR